MNLLSILQEEGVSSEGDKVLWKETDGERFLVREVNKEVSLCSLSLFLKKGIWVPCVPTEVAFFCLGGSLGQGSHPE